jgi:hypothetical protein
MIETIDRQTVIRELEKQGKQHLIDQATQQLPEQVHLEKNAVELEELGLDPRILAAKYTLASS